jgi:hypothetical protein
MSRYEAQVLTHAGWESLGSFEAFADASRAADAAVPRRPLRRIVAVRVVSSSGPVYWREVRP